jgi:hypothetical protein
MGDREETQTGFAPLHAPTAGADEADPWLSVRSVTWPGHNTHQRVPFVVAL